MRLIKRILLALAVVVLAFVVYAAIQIVPMMVKFSKLSACETGLVAPDLYAVRDGHVAIFVLKSGEDLIAFDAGNAPTNIEAGVRALGFDPLKFKAVFLTHTDPDHTKGLPLFKNAAVYLSEREGKVISGEVGRRMFGMRMTPKLPVAKRTLLADGTKMDFGGHSVVSVPTPGHTYGSTSYLIDGKYLVVGDLAIIEKGSLVAMPSPPTEDLALDRASVEKVLGMKGLAMILTAHAGVYRP